MLTFIHVIDLLFLDYTLLLVTRIFSSWIPQWNHTRPMQFVAHYTDPYLGLFRRIIPPLGMIDLSPLFAFLGLRLLQWLVGLLLSYLILRMA